MDTLTLCGWTAYQWHRIPPLARMLYLSDIEEDAPLRELLDPAAGPLFGGIDYPLHALVRQGDKRPRSSLVVAHARKHLPAASNLVHIHTGLFATDPLFTLLTLADQLEPTRLALAISELCGTFAIFQPEPEVQTLLSAIAEGHLESFGDLAENLLLESRHGWQQASDISGKTTDLWSRRPIITRSHLEAFVASLPRTDGKEKLERAMRISVERAASPFEVEAAILLGAPRRLGGEGLGMPECNREIVLSEASSLIAGQRVCYGDLCFSNGGKTLLDIECHSRAWHDKHVKAMADAARATALRCMGIDVLFLTKSHLASDLCAAEIARTAQKILKIKVRDPSVDLLERRQELRRQVLVPWDTFGL